MRTVVGCVVAVVAAGCAEGDPVFGESPVAEATAADLERWDQAHAWGNHAAAGYLKTEVDPTFAASPVASVSAGDVAHWDLAHGWGDHAIAGYLKTEVDPTFAASPAGGITATQVSNWDNAYAWGNHAYANYQPRVNGSCPAGYAVQAISGTTGAITCAPIPPPYAAGPGIAIMGSTISVPTQGIGPAQIANGAVGIRQLTTFTSGVISSAEDVVVRSHYLAATGGLTTGRMVVSTGGMWCGAEGCGSGVVTLRLNGAVHAVQNVNGNGAGAWTYVLSFPMALGTTVEVSVRANDPAAPVWVRDLTIEWGD